MSKEGRTKRALRRHSTTSGGSGDGTVATLTARVPKTDMIRAVWLLQRCINKIRVAVLEGRLCWIFAAPVSGGGGASWDTHARAHW